MKRHTHEARGYSDGRWECLICKRPIRWKLGGGWVLVREAHDGE